MGFGLGLVVLCLRTFNEFLQQAVKCCVPSSPPHLSFCSLTRSLLPPVFLASLVLFQCAPKPPGCEHQLGAGWERLQREGTGDSASAGWSLGGAARWAAMEYFGIYREEEELSKLKQPPWWEQLHDL